jgi:hypothetical protein
VTREGPEGSNPSPGASLSKALADATRLIFNNRSMNGMGINLKDICDQILSLDGSIRFAGIANKMGKVIAHKFRSDAAPMLSFEELEGSVIKSVLRMKTREDYETKLGRAVYTFTLYEKVKRASIPLQDDNYVLLIVSFEKDADHESIILSKILPALKQEGLA